MTKQPLVALGWCPINRANGRSSNSPNAGIKKPMPTSPKSTTPTHIKVFCGRFKPERISDPTSTRRLKLNTSPRTIATERRQELFGAPKSSWRRSVAIVLGLVLSFSLLVLVGSEILSGLNLPQNTLMWVGVVLLG